MAEKQALWNEVLKLNGNDFEELSQLRSLNIVSELRSTEQVVSEDKQHAVLIYDFRKKSALICCC